MDEIEREHPYYLDNIFTERLWPTIKYEEVYLHEYSSPKEAHQFIAKYIGFYNCVRRYQSLNYHTLADFYLDGINPESPLFPPAPKNTETERLEMGKASIANY